MAEHFCYNKRYSKRIEHNFGGVIRRLLLKSAKI